MTSPYLETKEVSNVLVKVSKQVSEVAEADELTAPHLGESLSDLHNRLLVVRSKQQRVSELVSNLVRVQALVRKMVVDRKAELDTAEAKVSQVPKQAFVDDYSSAKERNAKLMAKTLDERVKLTAVQKLQIDADASLAYAQSIYRELGNQAQDVQTRIRILGMEGTWSEAKLLK